MHPWVVVSSGPCVSCTLGPKDVAFLVRWVPRTVRFLYVGSQGRCVSCTLGPKDGAFLVCWVPRTVRFLYVGSQGRCVSCTLGPKDVALLVRWVPRTLRPCHFNPWAIHLQFCKTGQTTVHSSVSQDAVTKEEKSKERINNPCWDATSQGNIVQGRIIQGHKIHRRIPYR
jgi:hypothetical protein